jgi:hypothetical protein
LYDPYHQSKDGKPVKNLLYAISMLLLLLLLLLSYPDHV